jgi:hypothetical protein
LREKNYKLFICYIKAGFPKLCSAERFRSPARFFLFRRKLKKIKNTLSQTKNIITVGDPNFCTIPYRSVPYRTLPFTVRIFITLAVIKREAYRIFGLKFTVIFPLKRLKSQKARTVPYLKLKPFIVLIDSF